MATPTPDSVAQKWSQNLGAATQRITDGVNGVTVAPGQAAARQKAAWVQNVTTAADKWAANVSSVPLSSWQQDMINKGVPRIASGASAAQGKFSSFMGQLLPYIEQQTRALPPRGNLDANIARLTAFVRGMAKFQRTRTPGQ